MFALSRPAVAPSARAPSARVARADRSPTRASPPPIDAPRAVARRRSRSRASAESSRARIVVDRSALASKSDVRETRRRSAVAAPRARRLVVGRGQNAR